MDRKKTGKKNDKKAREEAKKKLRYFAVIAAAFVLLLTAVYFANPSRWAKASVPSVDEGAVSSLQAMEEQDVGEIVRAMRSIEASRKEAESSEETNTP